MKAKANLFRTLLVLPVVLVAVVMALFGPGIGTAETQTTTSASTTTYYKVQDLGTLPGATYSPPTSAPYGINDSGHVVGYANVSVGSGYYFGYYEYAIGHAFLYDGAMKDLGTLGGGFSSGATAINSSGQVVGNSVDGSWISHAFLYKDGVMKELSTLGAIMSSSGIEPGPDSQAFGINDSGQVVGLFQVYGTDYYANNYHAYLYDSESATPKMTDLGLLGGTYTNYYSNSQANGINNKGQVVGWSAYDDIGHVHAFLYDSESATPKMKDLGDLSDLGGTNSYAYGINTSGQVVGQAQYVDGGAWHAYLYDSESATPKMTDLDTLGEGGNSSAYAINDSGQVVGFSSLSSGGSSWSAFLYDKDKGMIDLGTLTHPDNNGNVWTLGNARDINNNGQIVADGSRIDANGTTVYSALLLTPTSDPPPDLTKVPSAPTISSPQNNTHDSDGSFSVSGSAEAGSTVELFEGTTSAGKIQADSSTGAWSIDLKDVSEGSHTYSAKATNAAGYTSYASNTLTVMVGPDTTKPSTSATRSVEPNAAGWNKENVSVNLKATDNEGGWGVKKITYSASGAQTIAQTDASGDSVNVPLDKEGTTTLTYYATDNAGNVEDMKTLPVKIDKTAPTVQSTSPADRAINVSLSAKISATFLESGSGIDPSTINTDTFKVGQWSRDRTGAWVYTPVSGKVSYDEASKTVTFTPSNPLAKGLTYQANIKGYGDPPRVEDKVDNALRGGWDYSWSFSTGGKLCCGL